MAEDTAFPDSLPELQDDPKLTGDAAEIYTGEQIPAAFLKALQCIDQHFIFISDQ